jgi:hypothetical protein
MLGRLSRGIGHKSGGKRGCKFRFDILVDKLDNLPAPVKRCRVVWSRGAKLQMTEVKDVSKGAWPAAALAPGSMARACVRSAGRSARLHTHAL